MRRTLSFAAITVGVLMVSTSRSQAAFTDNFDSLLTELQDRSLALSNSTDKIEQKQFKAVNKVIAGINKPATSLATDLKTAVKVAKSLQKAFPTEFPSIAAVATLSFSNNLSDLLTNVFDDILSDIVDSLDQLITTVNNLPPSSAKDKALAAIAQAQVALAQAGVALDFKSFVKALTSALKAIANGQKAAASAGGGGGGTNDVLTATIIIGGTNYNWSAATGIAEYSPTSVPSLDIAGGDGVFSVNSTICSNFTGAVGDYALGSGCPCGVVQFNGFIFYSAVEGTLHIASFSTGTTSLSGTFAYSASDGTTTITVTNGIFDLHNLQVSP